MNQALGIIEVVGFTCAVKTADVMAKTATVSIIGIERAKGSGWLTIKITGDVGAVNAGIEAGKAIAKAQDQLIAALVIPRMADGLADIWLKKGLDASTHKEIKNVIEAKLETLTKETPEEPVLVEAESSETSKGYYTCNLCKDPACPRKKGEARSVCIHYDELKNKKA